MRFFFDRCVPVKIAHAVAALAEPDIVVVHLDDDERFTNKTADVDWLKRLETDGDPAWIVVSGDGRILKNKAERKLLDETGLRFFCCSDSWPNMPLEVYAWRFVKVWFEIVECAKRPKGRLFQVGAGASLKIDILA